jgi:hypothetical protein
MRYISWIWLLMGVTALGACDAGTALDETDPVEVLILPARDTLTALQDTVQLTAEVRDREGRVLVNPRLRWTSLDTAVARVDSVGRVVSLDVGRARIRASVGAVSGMAEIFVVSGVPSADLAIVRFAAGKGAVETRDISFWASRERGGEVRLRHRADRPGEGPEFLRFKIPGKSLLRYPSGQAFGDRDSVLIRLQIEDPARFLFRFEPSGLRFDPDRPAELEVEYQGAESEDVRSEDLLALWRQEHPDSAWVRLATVRLKENDEVRARITGFTGFALATNRR